jgi:hypothetical protein
MQGIVEARWLGLHVLSTVHGTSGSCATSTLRREYGAIMHKPRVADEEEHVPKVLVNNSHTKKKKQKKTNKQKHNGTLHLLVSYIRQVVLRVGYLRCPSRHWTRFYLSRHWFLDTCQLGIFFSFKWTLYPLRACNSFFKHPIYGQVRQGWINSPLLVQDIAFLGRKKFCFSNLYVTNSFHSIYIYIWTCGSNGRNYNVVWNVTQV